MKFSFEKIRRVPKTGTLALSALVTFIPFFFITLLFVINEHAVKASSGFGVLDFELAWNPGTMRRIFAAWGPAEMRYQAFVTYVDCLYLVIYALFAALLILLIARRLRGRLQEIGFLFTLTPVLAAIFDALENTFLLSMLNRGAALRPQDPYLASLLATLKIAFLAAALSFIFVAALLLLVKRCKVPDVYYYLMLFAAGGAVIWLLAQWRYYLCFVIGPVYFAVTLLLVLSARSGELQHTTQQDIDTWCA
jgi:hypothetical protein